MALEKEQDLKNGIIANYWRILNVHWNVSEQCVITLGLYLNKEARELYPMGFLVTQERALKVPLSDLAKDANPMAFLYAKLKESQKNDQDLETNDLAAANDA